MPEYRKLRTTIVFIPQPERHYPLKTKTKFIPMKNSLYGIVWVSSCNKIACRQSAKKVLGFATLFCLLNLFANVATAQVTYVWNKTGSASFTDAANWTPARNTPATTDILLFNGNGTSGTITTVTNLPSQTISGLQVSNNTSVTITTPNPNAVYTLSIANGSAANDLTISSGSQLNLAGNRQSIISVAAGAKALINGNITLSNAAHQLLAVDAGAVTFSNPAVFTASTGFTGNAFGNTGTAGTVIFSAGTVYASEAGNAPFGLAAPLSKVIFKPGSLFRTLQSAGGGVELNGRAYGIIEFNGAGTADQTGTLGFTADSLRILRGTVNIGMTTSCYISGNINVARGARLNLTGNGGTFYFNGATQNIYGGGGGFALSNGQLMEVSVGTIVNLSRSITVTGSTTIFTVKGTLNTRTNTISGTGKFILSDNATLGIGSGGGIAASGTNSGNIRTTTRTYSAGANYVYTGTANQSTGNGLPASIRTLTINNTGGANANRVALTAAVAITSVVNSLKLQAGLLNLNSKQLTIPNGGILVGAGGNFHTTAGPLAFAGSGTVTGTVTIPTVTVAGAVNFGTATTIRTTLQVNSGGSVVTNSPVYMTGSTLIYASGDMSTGSEWNNGTAVGTGVPSNVNINLASASNNLFINGDKTVVNVLTLTRGNISIGANLLTVNGAITRGSGFIAGSVSSGLAIGSSNVNLYFASGGTNDYLNNLTIKNAATATLRTSLNIAACSCPYGSGEGVLTVVGSGVLTSGGFLTLKSNENGTARIAQGNTAGGYITGAVTVERYIPRNASKGWRLLASNTSGQTINAAWQEGVVGSMSNPKSGYGTMISKSGANAAAVQVLGFDTVSAGVSLYYYDPATDNLMTVANTLTTNINSQQGYFLFVRGDRSPGQFNAGSVSAPTTSTVLRSKGTLFLGNQPAVATGTSGWALVRNPYPSRIDMRNIVRGGLLVDAYQVWDSKLSGGYGVGGYQTFTKSGSNYVVSPGGGSYGANGSVQNFIESGAAFFIQGTAGSTAQVTEACKTSSSSNNSYRPSDILTGQQRLLFNLYAINPTSTDMVDGGLTFFNDVYSDAVDIEDVRKSPNFRENFGLLRDAVSLVVEKRSVLSQNDTMFFDMSNIRQISYRLDIQLQNADPLLTTGILEDKYTNTSTALDLTTMNSYTFTADANAASRAADRFRIIFNTAGVVPVSFKSIQAVRYSNKVVVDWKVANQVNISHYEVERSNDGTQFSKITSAPASMINSNADYSWSDENVLQQTYFYRIKAVDRDGTFKYSTIAKAAKAKQIEGVAVISTLIDNGVLKVRFAKQLKGRYTVQLFSANGQLVFKNAVECNGSDMPYSLVLPSALTAGMYEVLVTGNGETSIPVKVFIK